MEEYKEIDVSKNQNLEVTEDYEELSLNENQTHEDDYEEITLELHTNPKKRKRKQESTDEELIWNNVKAIIGPECLKFAIKEMLKVPNFRVKIHFKLVALNTFPFLYNHIIKKLCVWNHIVAYDNYNEIKFHNFLLKKYEKQLKVNLIIKLELLEQFKN